MTRCALPPGSSIAGEVSIYLPRRRAPLHLLHHVAIGSKVRPLSSDRSSQMNALADHLAPCPIQNELEQVVRRLELLQEVAYRAIGGRP